MWLTLETHHGVSVKQLVTLSGHSGSREKWMWVHLALLPFSHFTLISFHPRPQPTAYMLPTFRMTLSLSVHSLSLKTPSQTCPEVCLLGDSQSSQVDLQLTHTYVCTCTYIKYVYTEIHICIHRKTHAHTYTQRKNWNSIKLVLNDEIKHVGTGDVKAGRKNRQKVTMVAELLYTLEAWRNRN